MPRKNQVGCGCCKTGACAATATYYTAGDWSAGVGGIVASDGSGGLDMSGDVDPSSFLGTDAYQIEFTLTGAVSFDIGGDTIEADASAQTITAGLNTVACGQSTKTPLEMKVAIRVTPTHICIWAFGNYSLGGGAFAYGILTVDRSSAVPATFSATWTSANISGFEISDATIEFDGSGNLTKRCWLEPVLTCPYVYIKALSNNHEYQGTSVGDQSMPDVSLSGWDPFAVDGGRVTIDGGFTFIDATIGNAASGYHLACNPDPVTGLVDDFTDNYQTTGLGDQWCSWFARPRLWFGPNEDTGEYVCAVLYFDFFGGDGGAVYATVSWSVAGSLNINFPAETSLVPYPKPVFEAEFAIFFQMLMTCIEPYTYDQDNIYAWSLGRTDTSFAVNSLSSGFTLSVTTTKSLPYNELADIEGRTCESIYDGIGSISGTWTV